jgi:hypothetical protein
VRYLKHDKATHNNDQERLNYEQDFGPEGNFDGNKQGVLDAVALDFTLYNISV